MAITPQYQAYLDSPEWRAKRLKVLNRAKFKCERCKKRKATQVHHLTYKRIFDEKLTDLQAVCADCHMDIHNLKSRYKVRLFKRFKKVYQRIIG